MASGINIGDAALSRLSDPGGFKGTIWDATARLDGLTGSKAELLEAVAYLACQANAYRSKSNEDAHLALSQVRTAVDAYDARMEAKA
jgi:hypothetical protein